MYTLGEEHELLRQTARELAEAKIAPFDYAIGYVRERRQFGQACRLRLAGRIPAAAQVRSSSQGADRARAERRVVAPRPR